MGRAFDTTEAPALALAGCLTDLAALLENASALDYQARPDGGVSGGYVYEPPGETHTLVVPRT